MLRVLDLGFGGYRRAIAAFLVDTTDGLALFDCGPSATLPTLEAELARQGVRLGDIGHLLLSHIHLDHAGGAGALVRRHPGLMVWVSEIGLPHLADPSILARSVRRLYGDATEGLWGTVEPVPADNLSPARDDVLGWEAFPATGHAAHHVVYHRDGTILAGDAAGVRVPPSRAVLPMSPPPDVDIEAWHATADAIRRRRPERLAINHFGVHTDVEHHLDDLDQRLDEWAERVRDGMDAESFIRRASADTGPAPEPYAALEPYEQSWYGLKRYWETAPQA